ncbi:MAG: EFR1 family ferrodoxin [Clostridiales bacterium]|jgi:ferredoxin|nr:EFR1 family ferrodoxin [Clostridiales bacterium]
MKNRIYFFTGTGNSLHLAEKIGERVGDCELVSIRANTDLSIPKDLDRLGFVFPVYFWGLPAIVSKFLTKARFPAQGQTYVFVAPTFGGIIGNSVPQAKRLLSQQGISLNYGAGLKMFKNAVTFYEMKEDVQEITRKTDEKAVPLIEAIAEKKENETGKGFKFVDKLHGKNVPLFAEKAKSFNVSDDCLSCGICANICPVQNIDMSEGKPTFGDKCESCLACLQHCPKRAINDGDKTQKRRRYTHPDVGYSEIMKYAR